MKSPRRNLMKQITKRLVISALLLCLFFIVGCSDEEDGDSSEPDVISKLMYAEFMQFNFRMPVDEEIFGHPVITDSLFVRETFLFSRSEIGSVSGDIYNYTDFILAYSEEEALQLPDDAVTAWPSTRTLGVINGLNWVIEREDPFPDIVGITGDIDLSEFSLEFPITLSDVVENWENVRELNSALHMGTRSAILEGAKERRAEAFSEELTQLAKERSEELPEANISQDDIVFAERFNFSFRMIAESEVITSPAIILAHTQVFYPEFNPFYTDFMLVETEEEASQLPDNVVAAWPSQELHERLNALNWVLQGNTVVLWFERSWPADVENINLEDFSFQFPITVSDMIEAPEKVTEMWRALEPDTRRVITHSISEARREGNSPEFLAELESLKEQREAESSE